ncbi:hypothetical protein P3T25_005434 [Paraburkholderia sp. GAS32]
MFNHARREPAASRTCLFQASDKLREESVTVELAEKYFTIAIVAALRHIFLGAESVMPLQ